LKAGLAPRCFSWYHYCF